VEIGSRMLGRTSRAATSRITKPYWSRKKTMCCLLGGRMALRIRDPSSGGTGIRLRRASRTLRKRNSERKR
jgi:hypothetical protein